MNHEFENPKIIGYTVYSKSGCPNCTKVKKYLTEALGKFYENPDQAKELCEFILDNRETTVKENIRLKVYKK